MNLSSCLFIKIKHDVFISFRGPDVRQGLLKDLTEKLRGTKVDVFVDDRLERGAEIITLLRKIERSQILLVILSEHYPSSIWCLKELAKMIECKERSDKQILLPVFYHVRPSDVRKQRGDYGSSLAEHEEQHKDEVPIWKSALEKASEVSGFEYPSNDIESEAKLIEKIVECVLKRVRARRRKRILCALLVLILVILILFLIYVFVFILF